MKIPFLPQRRGAFSQLRAAEASPPGDRWDPFYAPNARSFVPMTGRVAFGVVPSRQIAQAERLYFQNPVYKRINELLTSHIYGNGPTWSVKAKDQKLKGVEAACRAVLDKTFGPEGNDITRRMPQWISEQCLVGEVCIPASVNPQNGAIKLGWIPARNISDVEINAFDYSDTIAVHAADDISLAPAPGVMGGGDRGGRRLEVISIDTRPYLQGADGVEAANPRQGQLRGDVFWMRTGALEGMVRGQGDAYTIHGAVEDLEQAIRDWEKRYDVQSSVVWALTLEGYTQEELDAVRDIQLPTGRVPFLKNDKTKLEMLAPSIKVEELALMVRTKMVYILGAVGIPEMVMADGAMTNVATAEQQMPTLESKFNLRRKQWASLLSQIARYALQEANERGMLWMNDGTTDAPVRGATRTLTQTELDDLDIRFELQPLERNDSKNTAATLTALTGALQIAVEQEWASDDLAGRVFRAQINQFGVSTDEDVERVKIADERAKKQGAPGVLMSQSGKPTDTSDIVKANG